MQEVKQYRSGQANMQHTGFFAEGGEGRFFRVKGTGIYLQILNIG